MTCFPVPLSQLLCFGRFRSRSRNDASIPHSPETSPPASSLRPIPEHLLNSATPSARPSTSWPPVDSHKSASPLFGDRPQDGSDGQPERELLPLASVDIDPAGQQPARPSSSPRDISQTQNATRTLTTPSQQSLGAEPLSQSSGLSPPQSQDHDLRAFDGAHDFAVRNPTFIGSNTGNFTVVNNDVTSSPFMRKLLKATIPGAEHDSSVRYPPPRCHAETRSAILSRCLYFISHCDGVKKTRWVVGAAGVGKSAIMQNVAESQDLPIYHASVFFSVIGRNDGTKVVMTISYQFAAKSEVYRQIIEQQINRDPSLLRSSIAKQFKKFIIDPFIYDPALKSLNRVLIIIDGLDECADPLMQQELLRLISDLCIGHPSSPLIWLIASRPEKHITSFFSRSRVIDTYEKEEIPVDSPDARADVELFLRAKLKEIQQAYSLDSQWPEDANLRKLADAAGGLFAYAQTVIRHIGDPNVANPASQLSEVLDVIDEHPMSDVPPDQHPMALLDALYTRIVLNVHPKNMKATQKLLLALASRWEYSLSADAGSFIILCNWLGITRDDAYAAVDRLSSVLLVPLREEAHREPLRPFHKSLIDYISDPNRSKFSLVRDEIQKFKTECAFRVLKEAYDGINAGSMDYRFRYGTLSRHPGSESKISLTWPVEKPGDSKEDATRPVGQPSDRDDDATRLALYKLAVGEVVAGIRRGDPEYQNEFCLRVLTDRFKRYSDDFPRYQLCELAFDGAHRILPGILKDTSLGMVRSFDLDKYQVQFLCPATPSSNNPRTASCQHKREDILGEGKDKRWKTKFYESQCSSCYQRLERQLATWNNQSQDHVAPVLYTSTEECCLEFQSVDSKDCMSHWVWMRLSKRERSAYGKFV